MRKTCPPYITSFTYTVYFPLISRLSLVSHSILAAIYYLLQTSLKSIKMWCQLYIHTLPIIFAVLFPSLAAAQTANSSSCGSEAPNGCAWTQNAWNGLKILQQDACGSDIAKSGIDSLNSDNGWAKLQVNVKPGYTNTHCWSATEEIISNCLGTTSGSGNSCSDADCNEWYWIWMNPIYRPGCWDGTRCVAPKSDGGC
jgi:hypothetical protein